ncbi:MAG: hypothetical protein INR72_17625 [Williamsia herbipolensis]|nr:hypothetical protein [Williamsia herbipolensis]
MSVQLIANVVIGLALVGFLAYRQMTWQSVDPSRIWRLPVILGIVGVVMLANTHATPTSTDVVFLGVEVLLSVAIGLTMGRITTFRTAPEADRRGRTLQTRTGWLGGVLWLVLIAVRVGLDVAGTHLGAHLLTSTGTILLTVAVNRAARALVVDQRMPGRTSGMMVR